jgi:D-alanyl-D-alanine carboxypeptidase
MQGASKGRRNQKRKFLITALTVVCILIAVFTFLIFAELFGWFVDKTPEGPGGDVVGGIKLEYEDKLVSTGDAHTGDLILINPSFPYTFPETTDNYLSLYSHRNQHDYVNTDGVTKKVYSYYTASGEKTCAKLQTNALDALNAWADDFYRATSEIDLFIYDSDGYRTEADQSALHTSSPDKYAPAGQTEHHTGRAVDLYIYTLKNQLFKLDDAEFAGTYGWLYKNAHKYGFIHRYPSEKASITGVSNEQYHFRYVGVAHATYMYQNGLCLEEYLDLLRDNYAHGEKHLEFVGENGDQYVVYFVKASSDSLTAIPVPKTDEKTSYEISGDNKEGFIVTVTITK